MTRFASEDAREARRVDAALDAAEADPSGTSSSADADPAGGGGDDMRAAERPRLWWEDDPRFADRFRRR